MGLSWEGLKEDEGGRAKVEGGRAKEGGHKGEGGRGK